MTQVNLLMHLPRVPKKIHLETLVDKAGLTIIRGRPVSGRVDKLVVVFGSLGPCEIGKGRLEFIGSIIKADCPCLFIFDHTLAWYMAPAMFAEIVTCIRNEMQDLGLDEITTIGGSMGGHAAVAIATKIPVGFTLALGPRFSADPAIVRDRRSRQVLTALSGRFAVSSLAEPMKQVRTGVILHGMLGPDRNQLLKFTSEPHIAHYLVPNFGHMVGMWLKKKDIFRQTMAAALRADRATVSQLLINAGALRRQSILARARIAPLYVYDGIIGRNELFFPKSTSAL